GTVSRTEVFQSFYAVGVDKSVDGNRHCSTYYWRDTRQQIRVDCKTVFGEAKPE
ncbi:EF-hand domain-containing protein, partial [Mycobacterium tuberculosis]